jgi:DNA-binding NarL/FixJ family response regulator
MSEPFPLLHLPWLRPAREHIGKFAADLVICDLQLADSDGLTIIAALRRLLPKAPVMLLTGVNFNPAEVDVTFGGLVSTYLPKPARLRAIAAAVARLIGPGAA